MINDKLAQTLWPGLDPVGRRFKVAGQFFEVVGLYAEPSSLFGDSETPMVTIPHSTFTKVADYWKGWMMFAVIPEPELTVAEAQDRVTAALRSSRALKPGRTGAFRRARRPRARA